MAKLNIKAKIWIKLNLPGKTLINPIFALKMHFSLRCVLTPIANIHSQAKRKRETQIKAGLIKLCATQILVGRYISAGFTLISPANICVANTYISSAYKRVVRSYISSAYKSEATH